ncbi:MAG: sigma-E factor regulatory protein RseB domain-containing protein [Armatimonadota bacterium]
MRRYIPCLMVIALLMAILPGCRERVLEAGESQQLLRDIRHAQRALPVRGDVVTRIRVRGEMLSAEARIHRGRGRMQLEFTTGRAKGAQIVQQQGSIWQISPDGETVRTLPHNPLDAMPRAGKNARVTVSPGSTIAGRPTDKITVKPPTQSQARLEIWADKANNFPLRMDRYNADGQLLSSTRYKEISFATEAPKAVELPGTAASHEPQTAKINEQKATELLGQDPVMPEYVPDGFDFQGYYHHQSRHGEIVALRYSDGVRLLNILQMQQPEETSRPEAAPDGAQPSEATGIEARRMPVEQGSGARTAGEHSARRQQRRDERGAGEAVGKDEADRAKERGFGLRVPRGEAERRPGARVRPGDDQQVWRHGLRGRMIRFRRDGLVIVVLGELPTPELRTVADGLRESPIDF